MRHFTLVKMSKNTAWVLLQVSSVTAQIFTAHMTAYWAQYHAVWWNASVKRTVKMPTTLKYNCIRKEISRHGIFVLLFPPSEGDGNPVKPKTVYYKGTDCPKSTIASTTTNPFHQHH